MSGRQKYTAKGADPKAGNALRIRSLFTCFLIYMLLIYMFLIYMFFDLRVF